MTALRAKGGRLRFGHFDGHGDFVPALTKTFFEGPGASGSLPDFAYNRTEVAREVLEYRTGAFIHGTLWNDQFVPHLGSPVVAAKSPEAAVGWRLAYNVNSRGVRFPASRGARPPTEPPIPAPLPFDPNHDPTPNKYVPRRLVLEPLTQPPQGWEVVQFERAYPHDFPQGPVFVVRVTGDRAEYGHLDAWGEFIPDYRLPAMQAAAAPPPARLTGATGEEKWRFTYNLPPDGKPEVVFEFRSGRLIKGTLHPAGHFAAEVGSTVSAFKSYKPGTDPRIYNLPGVLKPVKP